MCKARWSEREKQRLHTQHWNGFAPVCFLKWRVSSSERAKRHSHPSQEHWYGFSPSADNKNIKLLPTENPSSPHSSDFNISTNPTLMMNNEKGFSGRHKSQRVPSLSLSIMSTSGFMRSDSGERRARPVSRRNQSACQVHFFPAFTECKVKGFLPVWVRWWAFK